jgi:hypothetical protein
MHCGIYRAHSTVSFHPFCGFEADDSRERCAGVEVRVAGAATVLGCSGTRPVARVYTLKSTPLPLVINTDLCGFFCAVGRDSARISLALNTKVSRFIAVPLSAVDR